MDDRLHANKFMKLYILFTSEPPTNEEVVMHPDGWAVKTIKAALHCGILKSAIGHTTLVLLRGSNTSLSE